MTLIEALRCTTYRCGDREFKCEDCEYSCVEWLDEHPDIPISADCVIDGREAWVSCDCDRILLEAAEKLEELTTECRRLEKSE